MCKHCTSTQRVRQSAGRRIDAGAAVAPRRWSQWQHAALYTVRPRAAPRQLHGCRALAMAALPGLTQLAKREGEARTAGALVDAAARDGERAHASAHHEFVVTGAICMATNSRPGHCAVPASPRRLCPQQGAQCATAAIKVCGPTVAAAATQRLGAAGRRAGRAASWWTPAPQWRLSVARLMERSAAVGALPTRQARMSEHAPRRSALHGRMPSLPQA